WGIEHVWRRKSVEWKYGLYVAALIAALFAVPVTYVSVRVSKPAEATLGREPPIAIVAPALDADKEQSRLTGFKMPGNTLLPDAIAMQPRARDERSAGGKTS